MGDEAPSAGDVAALRDALLRHQDELVGSLDEPPGLLERLRPRWLFLPVSVVVVIVQALLTVARAVLSGFPADLVSHERVVDLYGGSPARIPGPRGRRCSA